MELKRHEPDAFARTEEWQRTAIELGEFAQRHRRWPNREATYESEASLSWWHYTQLMRSIGQGHRSHLFTAEHAAFLTENAPRWDEAYEEDRKEAAWAWGLAASSAADFIAEHWRLPSAFSEDVFERALGEWLCRQNDWAATPQSPQWRMMRAYAMGWLLRRRPELDRVFARAWMQIPTDDLLAQDGQTSRNL